VLLVDVEQVLVFLRGQQRTAPQRMQSDTGIDCSHMLCVERSV